MKQGKHVLHNEKRTKSCKTKIITIFEIMLKTTNLTNLGMWDKIGQTNL